jgi:hypothetical protein
MSKPETKSFGSWKSPFTAQSIASGTIGFQQIAVAGSEIYWVETRPSENGRYVVVKWNEQDGPQDVTPIGFSARTTVNSYGGASMTVGAGGVYFSNFDPTVFPVTSDQRLYRQDAGMQPVPITPQVNMRYSDGVVGGARNRLICVREDSTTKLHGQAQQSLVAIDLDGRNAIEVLAEGAEFYASPRLSPDSKQLAWITWNYPCMPWAGTVSGM